MSSRPNIASYSCSYMGVSKGASLAEPRSGPPAFLLEAERRDRIEARGLHGGPEAEEQPRSDRNAEPERHGPRRNGRRYRRQEEAPRGGDRPAERDAERAAETGQGRGLDEELRDDVRTLLAD